MDSTLKRSRGRPRAFNPAPEQTTVQALDRALGILKVLADGEGMSLTELSEAAGQAPATVYRVLSTFEAHGIVEFHPAAQLWFVGQEAFRIGSAFLGRTSLVEQARTVMHELMAATGETANLAIADGGQVVFISQVETHEPIRAFFRPGTRGPIHASGIGKALLAYHAPEAVERIVRDQGLPAFTPQTITDPDRLLEELAGSGCAAGPSTTRNGPRACAASRRRSSTSSARRRPACRSRARWCAWPAPATTSAPGSAPPPTGSPGRSAAPPPETGRTWRYPSPRSR
jgi:IclR family acetate operon transcriptional repressor